MCRCFIGLLAPSLLVLFPSCQHTRVQTVNSVTDFEQIPRARKSVGWTKSGGWVVEHTEEHAWVDGFVGLVGVNSSSRYGPARYGMRDSGALARICEVSAIRDVVDGVGAFEFTIQLPASMAVGDEVSLHSPQPAQFMFEDQYQNRYQEMHPGEIVGVRFADPLVWQIPETNQALGTLKVLEKNDEFVRIHLDIDLDLLDFSGESKMQFKLDRDFRLPALSLKWNQISRPPTDC